MTDAPRLLLLAGSAEARVIARGAEAAGWAVTAWVSEPPRGSDPMPVTTELRRFEDGCDLRGDMAGFTAVVDASHGFDAGMTAAGFAGASALGLPFLRYARPLWAFEAGWQSAPDVAAAMALIKPEARVFSATGWASLPEYAGFKGAKVFLRQTHSADQIPPADFVETVVGTPPFSVASETELFKVLGIDTLVCRNLGGVASRPKLEAALALGIDVILIAPPARPAEVAVTQDIDAVLEWLADI